MAKQLHVLVAPAAYVINDNRTESLGTITYYLLRELGRLGVKTTALTMKSEITNPIPNCRIIELLPGKEVSKMGLLRFMTKYYHCAKNLLRSEEFDLAHHVFPFGWQVGFNPLALRGHLRLLPFVIGPLLAPHTSEVKLSDEKSITKSYGQNDKRLSISQLVDSYIFDSLVKIGKKRAYSYFRQTLDRADWVVSGDQHTYQCFSQYVDPKKHSVFRIGIDLEAYRPADGDRQKELERAGGEGQIEILTVGYLVERKGIKYLIEGFAKIAKKYPNCSVKVVGDGPARASLEQLAADLGVKSRVKFLGSLKHNKVIEQYQACDIFCLPALSETWVVAQEAMACGKPVILTNTGSHSEHVPDGQVGYLVPLKDSQAITDALEKFLQDPAKIKEMGYAARRHVEKNYNWQKIGLGYFELYRKLTEQERSRKI